MRILYYSLFSPYITYCAEIWGNTYAKIAEIMYKAFHNSSPYNIQKCFVLYDPIYMTRANCVFKQNYARTKTMCISINGVKLWNSRDTSLIHCKSVHLFKWNYAVQVLRSYVTNEQPDYGEKLIVLQ